ncbi:hypothetical protein LTR53_012822 [Teratosphaeriaceae sp. CCFEE 6253]|nr:hypothetical protein LTR53_012822 [Teratosphaeriaceae sp. CCFEE 6253]
MASDEMQRLLRILDDRNVPLGHDDVAGAFEHVQTEPEIRSWVREYLSPSTLLTRAELGFHNAQHRSLDGNGTQASGRPLEDSDFETAIASLVASTAAIEQQCQLMESQRQALIELTSRNASLSASSTSRDRQQKTARENAQLDFEVDGLADGLHARLQASTKQARTSLTGMLPTVDRILEKDDRLLDGLQKILPKLVDATADQDAVAEVDLLCGALTMLSARDVRLRIDEAYKSSSGAPSPQRSDREAHPEKQQQALRAELEELSHEIDSLATMAVHAQYRTPMMRNMQGTNDDAASSRAQWSDYVAATLQYLTTRLWAYEQHYQDQRSHDSALTQLTSALNATLAMPAEEHMKRQKPPHANGKSPVTPTAKGLKPLRLVQANFSEPQDPVAQILRAFDIRVDAMSDPLKLTATLEQASRERQARLGRLRERTECTISDQLAATIAGADNHVQHLLAAVYTHTRFGSVKLVDPEVDLAVAQLEARTQHLGEEMRGLDVEAMARALRQRQTEIIRQ